MDYITPLIKWLLTCPYVRKNKVFANALQAQKDNIEIVTQQISRSQDKCYIDGSVLHRIVFTVFDYKCISFNQLVKTMVDKNENVANLLETRQLIDWIATQRKSGNYPDFGTNCIVQDVYTEYSSPSTPSVDNSATPAIARYSLPIICEVLCYGN